MDSKIVYCTDEKYLEKLESLRKKVNDNLLAPFSRKDYIKAERMTLEELIRKYNLSAESIKRIVYKKE